MFQVLYQLVELTYILEICMISSFKALVLFKKLVIHEFNAMWFW